MYGKWGGVEDLGLQGVWFTWVNPQMLISAWRLVGICQQRLTPQAIDRSNFVESEFRSVSESDIQFAKVSLIIWSELNL